MLSFRDVVVTPYTDLLSSPFGGHEHRGGPAWPDWPSQTTARHCRRGRPVDVPPEPATPVATIDDPIAWGGPIVRHFGHQIGDFSMRILPTLRAAPGMPMAFASHPIYSITSDTAPSYFWAILEWFGLPRGDALFVSEPTLVPRLVVLPQAEQLAGPGPDAGTLDMLDELVERRLDTVARTGAVYVSRASQVARFAAEEHLERVLTAAGVAVIRPEAIPLVDQLRIYASADMVIFAEGSALHATQLLGRSLGDVVVINRRPMISVLRPSLEPRARSLTYVDAVQGLIHPLRPSGDPAKEHGVTLLDPERLLDALADIVPSLRLHLDPDAYQRAQGEDVLRWLAALEPRFTSSPDAMDHLLKTIRDAGVTWPGVQTPDS
jgi:hypothetical protein